MPTPTAPGLHCAVSPATASSVLTWSRPYPPQLMASEVVCLSCSRAPPSGFLALRLRARALALNAATAWFL